MKMKVATVTALFILVVFRSSPAWAQSSQVPVYVNHSGDDGVGAQFVYQLREQLRKSSGYPLATSEKEAALLISVVSVNGGNDPQNNFSAVSVVIMANQDVGEVHLSSMVYSMGRNRTNEMSTDVLGSVDRAVTEFRKATKSSDITKNEFLALQRQFGEDEFNRCIAQMEKMTTDPQKQPQKSTPKTNKQ